MTTHQDTPPTTEQDPPSWGGAPPSPGPGRWSARRTAAVACVAVAIAATGGVAVYATGGSDTTSTSSQGPGGGAPNGTPGGAPGGSAALHGTYTVADDSGTGYHTELTQSGKVTAVSATSITLVSDDDYTRTYTVDTGTVVQTMSAGGTGAASSTSTLSSIATGDEVTVTAAVSGSTAAVDTIVERT